MEPSAPTGVDPKEAAERFFRKHPQWAANSLRIRDKTGTVVPLHLTPAQIKLHQAIDEQFRAGKPVRIVVLKARQVHMSVGAALEIFKRVAFLPGQQAMAFGDIYRSAKNLWSYYRQFDESYNPTWSGIRKLQTTRILVDREIQWEGGSRLECGSADSITTGRSYSIRHLHLSEYAFYRDTAGLMTGLMQSVPDDQDTTVIVESTANGIGGPFYELWMRASDPATRSDWRAVFFAWWEHPEYVRTPDDPERFERSLTDEERELALRHRLTLEQLYWRRWAIENKCEGSIDRFHQEYPATPEEAFLTSGRPRFDLRIVERQPVIRDPICGQIERDHVGVKPVIRFVPREDQHGIVRVWKRPAFGHLYIIGADPAHGIDAGEELGKSDPDYSVACIIDRDSGEQVAVARARITPSEFGDLISMLGEWYNWAFLVPEANPIGVALIEAILRNNYPIERIYRRDRIPGDTRAPHMDKLGWLTTSTSKPQLISMLDRALRDGSVLVRDPITVQELRTFVYDAKGKMAAQPGCHDDCVIALALAVAGLAQASIVDPFRTPKTHAEIRPVRYSKSDKKRQDWVSIRW